MCGLVTSTLFLVCTTITITTVDFKNPTTPLKEHPTQDQIKFTKFSSF